MSGKQRLASILMSIVMLLGMAALSVSAEAPTAAVYVSAEGNDNNDGSVDYPFATLAKAVDAAKDGATIYVMSNLTIENCARFYDKHLTITSYGGEVYTITRGEGFETLSDTERSWYNPAMIEVGSELPVTKENASKNASLRLENIILDDAGKRKGDVFAQAVNKDGSVESQDNLVYVQDAMIASYSGSGTITLGKGAILRNFGGMSAVRVTGGSKVIMESGSAIKDTTVTDRTKGNGGTGAAGAIWLQDGIFEMKNGAEIRNLIGRAVYADPGDIEIDGTILGITADKDMWQGKAGAAIHLRNEGGSAVLSEHALIAHLGSGESAVLVQDGDLTVREGAVLQKMNMTAINFFVSDNSSTKHKAFINGEICEITSNDINNQALNINQGHNCYVTIGPNAKIHDNVVWYGAIYMQGENAEMHVYGKIYNNYSVGRGGAISVANNFGPNKLYLYGGAKIYNNFSQRTGGGIMITTGRFTMYGGEIYNNTALEEGGGVYVQKGGSFIMEGGSITGNRTAAYGGGVAYDVTSGTVYAELKGGTISGNYMGSVITRGDEIPEYVVTDKGRSNDIGIGASNRSNINNYLLATKDATIGNKDFYFKKGTFSLDYTNASGMKLGNTAVDLAAAAESRKWGAPLVTFWAQTDAAAKVTLEEIRFESTLPVYAILQPVDASGAAVNDAIVANASVSNRNIILTVPASEYGYAIAIVQPTQDYGTVTVTGTPAIIYKDDTPKKVTFTVTYEISENLKNMMKQNSDIKKIKITLMPDARLSTDGTLIETVDLADKITKTFTLTLHDDQFVNGGSLVTTAQGSIVINQNQAIIPGNQLYTTMKTPARYDVTYRWENAPAGVKLPDDATGLREGSPFTVDSTYTEGYEVETEEGTYIFSGWSRTGTITVNGNITITGSWSLDGETEDEENNRYMFLWLTGFVKLYAEDAEDETRLPGAVYELHKLGKRGRFMDTYTTDENGEIYLKHLTIGDYVLIQTAAPEGYELDSEPIEFTVRVAKLLELVDHCEQIDAEEQD